MPSRCSWARPSWPRRRRSWRWTDEGWDAYIDRASREWGTRPFALYDLEGTTPSLADDTEFQDWYVGSLSLGASAATAEVLLRIYKDTNIHPVLGSIRVPTLVLQRPASEWEPIEMARHVASLIPGAKLVELPGSDFTLFVGDVDPLTDEIEEFLTGVRHRSEVDRVLATVLFTDIVGSTETAARLGDAAWKELLAAHDEQAKQEIERHRGRYIHTTGDGLLATFDGPARAVRCAHAIIEAVRPIGLEIRAGCHTGEIELAEDDAVGIAVHVGARPSGWRRRPPRRR